MSNGSSNPEGGSSDAGSQPSGGVPGSPDAGLADAQTDANTCFGQDPVAGVVPVPCPPPPGNLTVVVADAQTKAPISGANVQIQGPQNSSGTTDAAGKVQFPGVPPGSYSANATKAGYTTGTASATVASGATTTANISLQKIVLEIVDMKTSAVVSGTTQTRIVGQKVQLQVRTNPVGQAMTNTQWTIPGDRVKNYIQSTSSGVKTDLAAADLQSTSIAFFWINGGSNSVQITAQVAGATLTASATYNVLRPTMDQFKTTTSSVNLCVGNYLRPGTWMAAYQPTPAPGKPGIQWDAKVTAPAGGDGRIAFTQLINPSRVYKPNAGADQTFSSAGVLVLDDGLGIQYAGTVPIAASSSAVRSTNDSPGSQLNAATQMVTDSDTFELYLMYQSSAPDSIWVTLGLANWNWGGQITRKGAPASAANDWNAPTATSLAGDPSGADSTKLPEWTSAFSSITFH